MTKINKVGKSTFVIAILSFLLVAVLAFGGTYAYFSAETSPAGGTVTMGNLYVYLTDNSKVLDGANVLGEVEIAQPNQEILNTTYTVDMQAKKNLSKNDLKDSNISAFVRVKITAELDASIMNADKTAFVGNTGGDSHITPATIFAITSNSDNWYYNAADGYTYYVTNKASNESSIVAELTDKVSLPVSIIVNKDVGDNHSTFFMGKTGTFAIVVEAIQADFLDDNTSTNKTYTVTQIAEKWAKVVDKDYTPPAAG